MLATTVEFGSADCDSLTRNPGTPLGTCRVSVCLLQTYLCPLRPLVPVCLYLCICESVYLRIYVFVYNLCICASVRAPRLDASLKTKPPYLGHVDKQCRVPKFRHLHQSSLSSPLSMELDLRNQLNLPSARANLRVPYVTTSWLLGSTDLRGVLGGLKTECQQ